MRYQITICREVYEYATVTIDAPNIEAAELSVAAMIDAQGHEYARLSWEPGDPTEDQGQGEIISVEEAV